MRGVTPSTTNNADRGLIQSPWSGAVVTPNGIYCGNVWRLSGRLYVFIDGESREVEWDILRQAYKLV